MELIQIKHIVLVILLGMVSCKQEPAYKIIGNIAGVEDGVKVYLEDGRQKLDSAVVRNGQFLLEGKVDEPFYASLDVQMKTGDWSGKIFNLFVENSEIHVEGDWENFFDLRITGSQLHDEYETFQEQLKPLSEKKSKLFEETFILSQTENPLSEKNIRKGMELEKRLRALDKQQEEATVDFIRQHPGSSVSLVLLKDFFRGYSRYTVKELEDFMQLIASEKRHTAIYKDFEKKLETYRLTAKGEKFLDFKVMDVNGKVGEFSDYVQAGKYNMLEVWASWCGFCRKEIPHLKLAHQKYGDRFNIISVSIDKEEEDWRKAMQEENMPYLQLRGMTDEEGKGVGDYYGFRGIPYCVVLDGDGRIVTVDARGASLDILLEELFKD